MTNKELYKEWVLSEPMLPIFMQPWWLDAVCAGKTWDVLLVFSGAEGGSIIAAMPYLIRTRFGFCRFVLMPQQTQICGPWLRPGADVDYVAQELDKQLSELKLDYYNQKYPRESLMPQAMARRGYTVTEQITYRVEDLSDIDTVIRHFSKNKARQLKRAIELGLTIDSDIDAEQFYRFHHNCLVRQGKHISYTREFLLVLERKTHRNHQSRFLRICTPDGAVAAAAFLVWDAHSLYYLIPSFNPDKRDTGAGALLVLEAMKLARELGLKFDFEGSMIPGVANHYRQFGSSPALYYSVEKYYHVWFRLLTGIQKLRLLKYQKR